MRSASDARCCRASASAASSRSIPISRSAPASTSALACPPSPTVASTNTPPVSGRRCAVISATSTGSWVCSDPKLRQSPRVVVGERLALHLRHETLVVPQFQVLHRPDDIDLAGHAGGVTQTRRNQHAALHVELTDLP